jgi:hypothetical protein
VINYMAGGVPQPFLWSNYPVHVVGEQVYRWLLNDPSNTYIEKTARLAPSLPEAVETACREGGTSNVIVFDRTPGAFRVSRGLGEYLLEQAPDVRREVEDIYLPKWLKQRGLA